MLFSKKYVKKTEIRRRKLTYCNSFEVEDFVYFIKFNHKIGKLWYVVACW